MSRLHESCRLNCPLGRRVDFVRAASLDILAGPVVITVRHEGTGPQLSGVEWSLGIAQKKQHRERARSLSPIELDRLYRALTDAVVPVEFLQRPLPIVVEVRLVLEWVRLDRTTYDAELVGDIS